MPLFRNVHVSDECYATIGRALDALTHKGCSGNEALEVLLFQGAIAVLTPKAAPAPAAKRKARG